MRDRRKIVLVAALILGLVLSVAISVSAYQIDEKVVSGSRYGLVIGDSTATIAEKIRKELVGEGWQIVVCAKGTSNYSTFDAADVDENTLLTCGVMFLVKSLEDIPRNGIKLELKEGELASIYRYRKLFEFP